METEFKVKTGEFEGPLEVLLEMVEKRKLHINDVSLAEVADTFIEHIKSFYNFPMADSADFILIASTLLLIKSKSLLPSLELSEEEKGNILDLEKRLELYKRIKESAANLRPIFGKSALYFANENKLKPVIFSLPASTNVEVLANIILETIKNAPKAEPLPAVKVAKVVSLEEVIDDLSKRIQKSIKMSFKDFAGSKKGDRISIIVSFLAMLELVKQGVVRVKQESHFEDIEIEAERLAVPKY